MNTNDKCNIVWDKMYSMEAKFQKTTSWHKKWYRYLCVTEISPGHYKGGCISFQMQQST